MHAPRLLVLAILSALSAQASDFVAVGSSDLQTVGSPKEIDLPSTLFCELFSFNITKALVIDSKSNVTLTKVSGNKVWPVLVATNDTSLTENCGGQWAGWGEVDGQKLYFTEGGTSKTDDLNACWIPAGIPTFAGVSTHNASLATDCTLYFAGFVVTTEPTGGASAVWSAVPSAALFGAVVSALAMAL
ncbi:hypothetical protein EXIGLDRAFT_723934 [Exidia glandulosa HHB12029]|uniref:Uncharacterized protein n=1 Tax=Exidia glandulosa HHB12029 TaxID=1314781 RepID=A0A165EM18_EXIGL|nr:hypothetical protein EXIGLDRAFT_723934 [Exidia glandulosa HHB12029]